MSEAYSHYFVVDEFDGCVKVRREIPAAILAAVVEGETPQEGDILVGVLLQPVISPDCTHDLRRVAPVCMEGGDLVGVQELGVGVGTKLCLKVQELGVGTKLCLKADIWFFGSIWIPSGISMASSIRCRFR